MKKNILLFGLFVILFCYGFTLNKADNLSFFERINNKSISIVIETKKDDCTYESEIRLDRKNNVYEYITDDTIDYLHKGKLYHLVENKKEGFFIDYNRFKKEYFEKYVRSTEIFFSKDDTGKIKSERYEMIMMDGEKIICDSFKKNYVKESKIDNLLGIWFKNNAFWNVGDTKCRKVEINNRKVRVIVRYSEGIPLSITSEFDGVVVYKQVVKKITFLTPSKRNIKSELKSYEIQDYTNKFSRAAEDM